MRTTGKIASFILEKINTFGPTCFWLQAAAAKVTEGIEYRWGGEIDVRTSDFS